MPWYKRSDGSMAAGEEKGKDDDIEFKPEKLKEDITKEFDTKFTSYQAEQDKKMQPLLDMASQLASDRAAAAKKIKDAEEKKNKDDNALTNEDFMLDPAEATRRAIAEGTSGLTTGVKMLAARGNIRETLQDQEYYHGDLKTKIDSMIAAQSLDNQCRSDVVLNCYKTVVFDHMKEINEGKIKAKTSSSTFEGGSTGGHKADSDNSTAETMTEDEKRAASAMGIKPDEWIKSRKELSFV